MARGGTDAPPPAALGRARAARAAATGLMAGGERGVARCLEILQAEVKRTPQLLGVRTLEQARG